MLDRAPSVSIIITAFNADRWIATTLESVHAQEFRDFEVVVVDDGSTDRTADVVERFPAPVRYIYQENRGQPAARNTGIRASRGVYVAFVDADDVWLPNKLERQMALFDAVPSPAWVYSDAYLFDSESASIIRTASQGSHLPEGDVLHQLLLGNFIPSPTPVVRREVFEVAGFFNELAHVQGGGGEDWDMWLRIAAHYPVGVVRAPLAKYRLHRLSMLQKMDVQTALEGRLRVLQEAFERSPQLAEAVRSRAVANQYLIAGRWMLGREMRLEARRYFREALRRSPASRSAWIFYFASLIPASARKALGVLRSRWWQRGLPSPGASDTRSSNEGTAGSDGAQAGGSV